jgi:alpha-L-fucosidase
MKGTIVTRTALGLIVLLGFLSVSSSAQQMGGGGEAHPALKTNRAALKKWQAMRLGMFIHWGPVTLRGTEIGWSRGPQVPIEDYDALYKEFNPALFNAKEWVSVARAAGMKYLVITSKHHDGFSLWDSKYTDYDIMPTPFHRDVLKELSGECQRQGIMFCTYYSVLDWHHPHYTTRYGGDKRPVETSDMNIYRTYLKNQVTELVKDYHTNILWFDGEWEDSWTHADGMDLYAYARSLNDSLLINNRVDKGRQGMKGMTASSQFAGDFGTPEQEIGSFDNDRAWESCITIGTQWSWKPNDQMKSPKECIQMLVKTAGGGGNLLLNISPMPDGRIEQRQIDRLQIIGRWLERYGESIYGTAGGPFKPTPWLASTNKANSIYVHLLRIPDKELRLPLVPNRKIESVRVLGGASLQSRTESGQIAITLPNEPLDGNDAVLLLDLNGSAEGIMPLEVPENTFKKEQSDVRLTNPPSQAYPALGARSLLDKARGTTDYHHENWMGFEKEDCEAVIDLHSVKSISKVTVGCLQNQAVWIFNPRSVEVFMSDDGKMFRPVGSMKGEEPRADDNIAVKEFTIPCEQTKGRYLKVRVENTGLCPSWHKGAGNKAWLFVDEILIN